MTEKSENRSIWKTLGQIGALLTGLWVLIQIVTVFAKPSEYGIEAKGDHNNYSIAPHQFDILRDYGRIRRLNPKIKSIIRKADTSAKLNYENEKINQLWSFTITNVGSNPLEELTLELPFSGFYELKKQKGYYNNGKFKDRIIIGDLAPGYNINVKAFFNTHVPEYSYYDEEKTRITHKYGWARIDYPVKSRGLWAWIHRNDYTPLFFFGFGILIIVLLVYDRGLKNGPKVERREKEKRLKELKELEKMKEEGKLEIDD